MNIYYKNIEGLQIPKQGTEFSAGYDIIATSEPKIIGIFDDRGYYGSIDYIEYETNLFIEPENSEFHTLIFPRSSISKYNLSLCNSIGLIDSDYKNQVFIRFNYIWQPGNLMMLNEFDVNYIRGYVDVSKIYKEGDKIAQLLIQPTFRVNFIPVDKLNESKRNLGAFGSTGK